ncbi:MAG TPA: M56 family metallopeptidase, partial [Caulobacteraceae bacterium]|nr:M56 family metallopeptidase [Caulobacteraceae bacterium]
MLAWMVYVTVVTLLLGLAALAAERSAQIRRAPTRWIWGVGIVASVALPMAISSVSIQLPDLSGAAGRFTPPVFPLRQLTAGALQPSAWLDTTIGPLGRAPDLDVLLTWAWTAASVLIFLAILGNGAVVFLRKRSWEGRVIAGAPVFVSEDVGPAVVGLLRPCVVVPRWIETAAPETQTLVLAHERSHLQAGDAQWLGMAILLIAAMPWNLPLWWQLRRLRFAIEVDCDRRVLNAGHDLARYGETLLMVGEGQSRPIAVVAAMSESRSFLEQRIRKMIGKQKKLAWAGAT